MFVWKYKCTDCAPYFCSLHCKEMCDDVNEDVDKDEEDPFTVLYGRRGPGRPVRAAIFPRRSRIGGLLGGALCGRLIVGQQVQHAALVH